MDDIDAGEHSDGNLAGDAETADVVVLGCGHDSLISAAYLARAGRRVIVIAETNMLGGHLSTIDALGARVSTGQLDHLMINGTPVVDELGLVEYGLDYIDVDPALVAVPWHGEPAWILYADPEQTLDYLRAVYPGEVDGYVRYLRDALPVARLLLALADQTPRVGTVGATIVRKRLAGMSQLRRWARSSATEVLDQYFVTDQMKAPALAVGPAASGADPSAPGTGLGALAYAMRHGVGVTRPRGGTAALAEAVARCIEDFGGQIRLGQEVASIRVEGAAVTAVELAGGDIITTSCVIAGDDPGHVITKLLGSSPDIGASTLRRYRDPQRPPGSTSRIDARVSQAPSYRQIEAAPFVNPKAASLATTVIVPTVAEIKAAYSHFVNATIADVPLISATVPSIADPSLEPLAGGHVLSLDVHYTPYDLTSGWSGSREPQRWLDLFCDRIAPGYAPLIEEWSVTTPVDVERRYKFPRGSIPDYAGTPIDAIRGRRRELSRYRLPIAGMFLTGHATYPGRELWGASGRNVAQVVLGS